MVGRKRWERGGEDRRREEDGKRREGGKRRVSSTVANRPKFFGTVPNSDAVSRVPNGSIRDKLMSRIFTEQKIM